MNMQDNEFDDLFRSRLDKLEVEPSAEVWQNIDAELDGKRRKRSIFPMLSIAASIIVLITAGILFIPKKENIKPGRHDKNRLAIKVKPSVTKLDNTTPAYVNQQKNETVAVVQSPVDRVTKVNHAKNINASINLKQSDVQQITKTETAKTDEQKPELIAEVQKPTEPLQPVDVDNSTQATEKVPAD